jgi:hypothetical protein
MNESEMKMTFEGVKIELSGPALEMVTIANRITNTKQPKSDIESLISMAVDNPNLIRTFQGDESINIEAVLPIVEKYFPQAGFLNSLPGVIGLFKKILKRRNRSKKSITNEVLSYSEELKETEVISDPKINNESAFDLSKARPHRLNLNHLMDADVDLEITAYSNKQASCKVPDFYDKEKHEFYYALLKDKVLIEGSETGSSDGTFDSSDDAGKKKEMWKDSDGIFCWIKNRGNGNIISRSELR